LTADTEVKFHLNRMRFMYAATAIFAGFIGISLLIAPSTMQSMFGYPAQEPIMGAVVYTVWLAFALLSIAGLRSPLKFAPILLLEITYKTIWLVAIAIPAAITGTLYSFALENAVLFVLFIVGYIIAMPWKYIFTK